MVCVSCGTKKIPLEMPSVLRKEKKSMGTWFITCVSEMCKHGLLCVWLHRLRTLYLFYLDTIK